MNGSVKMKARTLFFVLIGALALTQTAYAQNPVEREYARPGYPTIQLYVWQPGTSAIWRVEQDADLIEILSATGVSAAGASGANERLFVSVYREEGPGRRRMVYSSSLDDILAQRQAPPSFQDRDVLYIESRRRPGIRFSTVASVVGVVSSILLIVLQVTESGG